MNDSIQSPVTDILPPDTKGPTLAQVAAMIGVAVLAVKKIAEVVDAAVEAAAREWDKAEQAHTKRALRDAYSVRQKWKKSDVRALSTLPINEVAKRKIIRLSGTGRPVVRPHQSLGRHLLSNVQIFVILWGTGASPVERRKAFWQWPWHEAYIEALYRGEHARAKAEGRRDAARSAETEVADALHISPSRVHKICGKVRRASDGDIVHAPVTIADFEQWMRYGSAGRQLH